MLTGVKVKKAEILNKISTGEAKKLEVGGLFKPTEFSEETGQLMTEIINVNGWYIEVATNPENFRLLNGRISKNPMIPRTVVVCLAVAEVTRNNEKMKLKTGDKVVGLWILD